MFNYEVPLTPAEYDAIIQWQYQKENLPVIKRGY